MPVIPQLSQVVKIGKTASGGLPAEASAAIDAASQAQVAGSGLQPIPFLPGVIPVIPFGIAISMIMTKIEAMIFKSFEDLSSITQQIMDKYNIDKTKAENKRNIANEKLYNDLINKQLELIDELKILKDELAQINITIPELEDIQTIEIENYTNIINKIKQESKNAELDGRIQESLDIEETIHNHDKWLQEINDRGIEIVMLELRIPPLEREIEEKTELTEIKINKDWDTNVDLADRFEVVVPPYPDLPDPPELPTSPPIPNESEFVKASRKAFAKWLVTPTIFPFGIPIATILLYIQAAATAPAPAAAQIESNADASILQGGGII